MTLSLTDLGNLKLELEAVLHSVEAFEALTLQSITTPKSTLANAPVLHPVDSYLQSVQSRRHVAPDLEECAWIILLDLFKHYRTKDISITSACLASGRPGTTALRHIEIILNEGLVKRVQDGRDKRRCYLELTDRGRECILEWILRSARHG